MIWNQDQVIIDIFRAIYEQQDPVLIEMNFEGPCLTHLGLYDLLDRICAATGFEKHRIQIQTANFLEQHDEYRIKRVHQEYELVNTQKIFQKLVCTDKIFDDDFKHFGHFIGHSNHHRLHLASALYAQHSTKTIQCFHHLLTDDYHRAHLGIEDFLFHGANFDDLADVVDLLKHSPMTLDVAKMQESLPSMTATHGLIPYYPKFFVEIVNQSYWSGRTFYVDEKIWRPVVMMTPFIVQGSKDFYHNLRRLGFRTFHDYWDEGYSEDHADSHVRAILRIVDDLASMRVHELRDMYQNMLPILEHNRNVLKNLRPEHFNHVFDDLL